MKKVFLVDYTRCSHATCGRPCITKCPLYISSKKPKKNQPKIEVPIRYKQSADAIIIISEYCIKCGICANVCPMKAIYTKNLLEEDTSRTPVHEYESDSETRGFRLYGLPTLVPGRVTGICGPNGIGKTTVFNLLSGHLDPNFGNAGVDGLDWNAFKDVIKENEMRQHFTGIHDRVKNVAYKEQVLQVLFERYRGKNVLSILAENKSVDDATFSDVLDHLDIHAISTRELDECSGGELQRFAIANVLVSRGDIYLFDEPCTFLDVKKRISLADLLETRARGSSTDGESPVLVVEHDLTVLDYLSDVIQIFYGVPHQFGVITGVQTNKAGINAYLDGYLKTENVQFRENQIRFRKTAGARSWDTARVFFSYGHLAKSFKSFTLDVQPGVIHESEIVCAVGENGLGKSTFAKMLAGVIEPDDGRDMPGTTPHVAYKPQYITREYSGTVKEFIIDRSGNYDFSEAILKPLYRPLGVDRLFDKQVSELSGGELQRAFITACLATRANLFILDEPSAYLDVEERLHVSSVIRSATKGLKAATICIEHDLQIADALADRMLIFKGEPGVRGEAVGPLDKREGMNMFLKILDITFRRDDETGRARINKKGSQLDTFQRAEGEYFYST